MLENECVSISLKCLHQFTVDGENVLWNWEIDFQINLQVSLYIKLCVL